MKESKLHTVKPSMVHIIEDFRGNKIKLYDHTVDHIKARHPEIVDPIDFVRRVLMKPLFITQDELPSTEIYHRSAGKPLMHVAYVQVEKMLVKSAHITDRVKGGAIVWMAEKTDILS